IIETSGKWLSIERIRPRGITRLANSEAEFFRESLHNHTKREWRDPKARSVAKYDLAVLYDPNEKTAPSSPDSIKHFARIAERMSVDVEPITKRQLGELAEFDGLFIRETTSIDNHTYRFARRAWQEGMPVIDDPISMIRCTNKVFLVELLQQNQVPTPPTVILAEDTDFNKAIDELGLPLVVKIPGGSFFARLPKARPPRRVQPHLRRVVRGNRSPAGAEIPTDRFRLAGWRARRRAALRLPIPHGPRPLAGGEIPAGRLLA